MSWLHFSEFMSLSCPSCLHATMSLMIIIILDMDKGGSHPSEVCRVSTFWKGTQFHDDDAKVWPTHTYTQPVPTVDDRGQFHGKKTKCPSFTIPPVHIIPQESRKKYNFQKKVCIVPLPEFKALPGDHTSIMCLPLEEIVQSLPLCMSASNREICNSTEHGGRLQRTAYTQGTRIGRYLYCGPDFLIRYLFIIRQTKLQFHWDSNWPLHLQILKVHVAVTHSAWSLGTDHPFHGLSNTHHFTSPYTYWCSCVVRDCRTGLLTNFKPNIRKSSVVIHTVLLGTCVGKRSKLRVTLLYNLMKWTVND